MTLEEYRYLCIASGIDDFHLDENASKAECYEYSTLHLLKNYRLFYYKFVGIFDSFDAIVENMPNNYPELGEGKLKKALLDLAKDEIAGRHIKNVKLLDQVPLAVDALRDLPCEHAEEYYKIIYTTYIDKNIKAAKLSEIQIALGMADATFRKYKKAAIKELAFILWGMTEENKRAIEKIKKSGIGIKKN